MNFTEPKLERKLGEYSPEYCSAGVSIFRENINTKAVTEENWYWKMFIRIRKDYWGNIHLEKNFIWNYASCCNKTDSLERIVGFVFLSFHIPLQFFRIHCFCNFDSNSYVPNHCIQLSLFFTVVFLQAVSICRLHTATTKRCWLSKTFDVAQKKRVNLHADTNNTPDTHIQLQHLLCIPLLKGVCV